MAASAAKSKSRPCTDDGGRAATALCGRELSGLWIGVRKARLQFSAAARYCDESSSELARHAVLEGTTTLRLVFHDYMGSDDYGAYSTWERAYRADLSEETREAQPATLADRAIREAIDDCAIEVNGCGAIPDALRDEMRDRLKEVATEGAGAVIQLVAECAIAERALKAKAR